MPNQHVLPRDDDTWGVRGAGNEHDSSRHDTQDDAFNAARTIARNQGTEVLVHGRNGQIRYRNSYGPDPYPPRG